MKTNYVSPKAVVLPIESDAFLALSGSDDTQLTVGNSTPTDDTDDNFFSNQRRGGIVWE